MQRLALSLLLLSLGALGACDSAPGAVRADAGGDPDESYRLASRSFGDYEMSYDWAFRIEGLDAQPTVPVSFRSIALEPGKQPTETSRITMTALPSGKYAFESSWSGFSHPNAWVYPIVRNTPGAELSRAGRYHALGDGPQETDKAAKSYHTTADGEVIIDYPEPAPGVAPTSVFIPSAGITIENVAYLVYVPKGDRVVEADDVVVQVYGPRRARVITESEGEDSLPRIVYTLLSSND